MRLDKYLKVSRLIKRRTIAKEASLKSRIDVNDKTSKPSTSLKLGDTITLHLGAKTLVVKVTSLLPIKDCLMYELVSETKL